MTGRLESWKEIAAHFGRRVRTVQRWEKEEGLPVHRHNHRSRGTVHAIADELDRWWAARTASPGDGPRAAAKDGGRGETPSTEPSDPLPPPASRGRRRDRMARPVAWMAGAAAAGALAVLLSVAAARRSSPGDPPVPEDAAPAAVLEARYLLNRGSSAEVERAIALCGAAAAHAEAEPARRGATLSPAARAAIHECLAHGALSRVRMGRGPLADGLLEATREAERALALDARRADAAAVATWAAFIRDWNALAAEAGYRRAIALDPAAGLPHHGLAHLLSARGRHDEAISELRRAQRAQPLSSALNDDGCWFFYRARRYEEGIAEAERALRLEPARVGALQCVLVARAARGEHREAREAAVSILRVLGDPHAEAVAAAPPEEARGRFDRLIIARLDERRASLSLPATPYALLYGDLGDRDRTIAWLDRALADHDPVLLLVRVHPAFDSLRSDSRLEPLLRRAGV